MVMDLGMLGFTLAILWLCLRQYKPRALGWFRSRAWPPKWTIKVVLACVLAFPMASFLADFSQASHWRNLSCLNINQMTQPGEGAKAVPRTRQSRPACPIAAEVEVAPGWSRI